MSESFDRNASHMAGEYVSYKKMTLTDEEIAEVIDSPQFANIFDLEDFAKAILKKANEKC